jgi:regulator of nonsense transcripts 2
MDSPKDSTRVSTTRKALAEDAIFVDELRALREKNTSPSQRSACVDGLKSLDSSMKKNTAVIRKLKSLSEQSAPGVLADLRRVNHSKYVSEAVSAILEAPLKLRDVKSVLEVASVLHQCYGDFQAMFFQRVVEELTAGGTNASKKRVLCRILFGCALAGIFDDLSFITVDKVFRGLASGAEVAGSEESLQSVSLVNAFLKAGGPGLYRRVCMYKDELYLRGLVDTSRTVGNAAESSINSDSNTEESNYREVIECLEEIGCMNAQRLEFWRLCDTDEEKIRAKIQAYANNRVKDLEKWWGVINRTKRKNDAVVASRGDISDKKQKEYQDMCNAFEGYHKAMSTLAATLGVSLPEFNAVEDQDELVDGGSVHVVETAKVFDDPDERALYMSFPQLREIVPPILLNLNQRGEEVSDTARVDEDQTDGDVAAGGQEHQDDEGVHTDEQNESIYEGGFGDDGHDSVDPSTSADVSLSELIAKLPECVTMEECDAFSVQFCYRGGIKVSSQKALATALSRPPHGAFQLLPFYSRIIATLSPYFPLVRDHILAKLGREFNGLRHVVDVSMETLEPRLRNARYISELVKFGVYPPGKAFVQLRSLFDDFSRQNIDTACCLVEHCGHYLFKRPDTSERMVNMMNIMIKLKNAKNLEGRHVELIGAAHAMMYGLDTKVERKHRSLSHEFIRYQIFSQLDDDTVGDVAKNLRTVEWKKEAGYVQKKILGAVRKGKVNQILPLAKLVLELQYFDFDFGIHVVDEVIEELFCGMDQQEVWHCHRRLCMAKFLGALCHVKEPGVSTYLIMDMMRAFMSYSNEPMGEISEPWFRVRLMVAMAVEARHLFQTKKSIMHPSHTSYHKNRSAKIAMCNRILPQLEEFVMRYEGSLSGRQHEVEFMIQGMLKELRIKKRRKFDSHEEAVDYVTKLMKKNNIRQRYDDKCDEGGQDMDEDSENDDDDIALEDEDENAFDNMERTNAPSQEELMFERELALALGVPVNSNAAQGQTACVGPSDPQTHPHRKLAFKIMTKRGGRDDKSKNTVHIPVSSSIIERGAKKKQAEADEKAALKRIVLNHLN